MSLPKMAAYLWVLVCLGMHFSFAATAKFDIQPTLANNSFIIPFSVSSSFGGFILEHQLDILHLDYPTDKYLIHTYQRKNITALTW